MYKVIHLLEHESLSISITACCFLVSGFITEALSYRTATENSKFRIWSVSNCPSRILQLQNGKNNSIDTPQIKRIIDNYILKEMVTIRRENTLLNTKINFNEIAMLSDTGIILFNQRWWRVNFHYASRIVLVIPHRLIKIIKYTDIPDLIILCFLLKCSIYWVRFDALWVPNRSVRSGSLPLMTFRPWGNLSLSHTHTHTYTHTT